MEKEAMTQLKAETRIYIDTDNGDWDVRVGFWRLEFRFSQKRFASLRLINLAFCYYRKLTPKKIEKLKTITSIKQAYQQLVMEKRWLWYA